MMNSTNLTMLNNYDEYLPIQPHLLKQVRTLVHNYWNSSFMTDWWDQYPQVADGLDVYTGHYIKQHPDEFDFYLNAYASNNIFFDANTGKHLNRYDLLHRINQYAQIHHLNF